MERKLTLAWENAERQLFLVARSSYGSEFPKVAQAPYLFTMTFSEASNSTYSETVLALKPNFEPMIC